MSYYKLQNLLEIAMIFTKSSSCSLCHCCSKLWVRVSGSFTCAIKLLVLMSYEANDASDICAEKSFAKLDIGTDSSVHLSRFFGLLNICDCRHYHSVCSKWTKT